jgi:Carboxypeptidase regulatory-like domain
VTGYKRTIRLTTCGLAFLLSCGMLEAQIDRGTISGTITDSSGALVAGATVTVTNVDTNQAVSLTADNDGIYTARLLQQGNYNVEASAKGFRTTLQTGITLNVNQVARVDFRLEVGTTNQVLEVNATPPLISTETSSLGTVETQQRIENLPLNGRLFTNSPGWVRARLPARARALGSQGQPMTTAPASSWRSTVSGRLTTTFFWMEWTTTELETAPLLSTPLLMRLESSASKRTP